MVDKNANSQKTLILIDGHALAFRSYFALERTAMKTSDNQPTWAVYGFFKAIFDILKNSKISPDAIAVAFDVGRQTFRLEKYPDYKANRETMPDTLHSQIGLIIEGLQALNIPIYTKEGFEADDVIGTIATRASKIGHKVFILTGDQDSFQLIDEEGFIRVLIPSKGDLIEYDCEKVYEKLGVYPSQIIDYKALRGDTSDNIPGIKGIGEKSAAKLLANFGNLENIYKNIEEVKEKALKAKLIEGEEIARLSQYLATIDRNVDIDFDIESTRLVIEDFSAVNTFFKKMQFYSFLKNMEKLLSPFASAQAMVAVNSAPSVEHGIQQLGLWSLTSAPESKENKAEETSANIPKIITNISDFDLLIQKIKENKIIVLDILTTSEEFWNADIVGIGIGLDHTLSIDASGELFSESEVEVLPETYYIPIFHTLGEQIDQSIVFEKIKAVLEDNSIAKIMHDAKGKINVLRENNLFLRNVLFDTALACYIGNPSKNTALNIQALENLDCVIQDKESIIGKGKSQKSYAEVGISELAEYACCNVAVISSLSKYWSLKLNLKEKKLLKDIEIPLSFVLADMEFTGVTVDVDYLRKISSEIDADIQKSAQEIYAIAGEEFNINSPKMVGEILFEKLNLKYKGRKKTKTGYSTSADVLESLAEDNEIVRKILEHRHFSKLKSTYVDALPQLIIPSDNRIHTTFNQMATLTGRLSSSNPNLQNIPIRTKLGNRIRGAFVPRDKATSKILSADYSQIELRLLAHISWDDNMIEAMQANTDIHTLTASKVFNVPVEEVTKEMRSKAKTVNFGIVYGQTKYGLAKSLNISADEAQEFIDKYFEAYPKILTYMEATKAFAQFEGYVETIYGRRRYLSEELNSPNFQIREFAQRAAINQPLQGTAADLIKIAMINLYNKLELKHLKSKIILQVHDELILEVDNDELDEVKELVKQEMELGQPLRVPLDVDIHVADSWMESE